MYAEVTLILIFPIQTSIEQKYKRAPLVLHRFVRHIYLREDHSMAQTVVSLSSSYTKIFWRTSCFFQKKKSSGIATNSQLKKKTYTPWPLLKGSRECYQLRPSWAAAFSEQSKIYSNVNERPQQNIS